jgi:hypothetical protein
LFLKNIKPTHQNESRRKFLKLTAFSSLLSYFVSLKAQAGGFISFAFFKKQAPVNTTTYVEDVFSVDIFTGNGGTQTITNGINFAGKGGTIFSASRTAGESNGGEFIDTVRGGNKRSLTTGVLAEFTLNDPITFNSNGFTMSPTVNTYINYSGYSKVVWSFRKAANFFDIVTYTGNGVNGRSIAHSLGITPGMIIIKARSSAGGFGNWMTWHRGLTANYLVQIEYTGAQYLNTAISNITSSSFSVDNGMNVNGNGETYVAYIFAHDTTSDGKIQCGSYTGTGTGTPPNINLGWEPQFIFIKNVSATANWEAFDSLRGLSLSKNNGVICPNISPGEYTNELRMHVNSTGFYPDNTATAYENTSGNTFIYVAVRRPNKPPTSGSNVLSIKTYSATGGTPSSITHDVIYDTEWNHNRISPLGGFLISDRLRGGTKSLQTANTSAESSDYPTFWLPDGAYKFSTNGDYDRWWSAASGSTNNHISYALKRAPGVFDMVTYTGNGASQVNIAHNLNAVPEFRVTKALTGAINWEVVATNSNTLLLFNSNVGSQGSASAGTTTTFPVYQQPGFTSNTSATNYIAYLFATKAGISKVGTYTGAATDVIVNCGFSGSARLVITKRTDSTGYWIVVDSVRGNACYSTFDGNPEVTANVINLTTGGFTAKAGTIANVSSTATYIFIAIS